MSPAAGDSAAQAAGAADTGTAARPEIVLIAAVARDGAIGRAGSLPWRLPPDLKRLSALTMGHPVVMGRTTWDSLPPRFRPLPGRRNLVATRQSPWRAEGAEAVASLSAAIEACGPVPRIYVLGGGQVYAQALPLADTLELTEVDLQVPDADAHFPQWDRAEFAEAFREHHPAQDGMPAFDFVTWRRRR